LPSPITQKLSCTQPTFKKVHFIFFVCKNYFFGLFLVVIFLFIYCGKHQVVAECYLKSSDHPIGIFWVVISSSFLLAEISLSGCLMLLKIEWSLDWDFFNGCFIYLFIVGGNNIKWLLDAT
jgi:hypothetical protein